MSAGQPAEALELVQRLKAAWQQAADLAIMGEADSAGTALGEAEGYLDLLLSAEMQTSVGHSQVEELLEHSQLITAKVEASLRQVASDLHEIGQQRGQMRASRLALQRITPQPRLLDERG